MTKQQWREHKHRFYAKSAEWAECDCGEAYPLVREERN